MTKKEIIARFIADNKENNYNKNLQFIYDNRYRLIDKVPTRMFFLGLLQTFKKEIGITIEDIKEVVIDALETSGIELTFTDNEWDNLKVTETNNKKFPFFMETNKNYMQEFFE